MAESGGWNTIESDAGVFTYLLSNLGVENVQFEELVSLDSETLAQLGAIGVIFLFKYQSDQKSSNDKNPPDGTYDYAAMERGVTNGANESGDAQDGVWFANQTIQNACGTQALLSVLMNKAGTAHQMASRDAGTLSDKVMLGKELTEFRDFTAGFPSELRGAALSNSELIRDVHNSFARSSPFVSEDQRTATDDDDVYHFIAYTSINDTLYELDGLQPAPISHGECRSDSTSAQFAEKIIPVLQRRIERYPAHEIRINLLAMCPDLHARARQIGDEQGVEREEIKRRQWQWENALRRHNFVGFTGELLKDVVAAKLGAGDESKSYNVWIDDATKRTIAKRNGASRRAGQGNDVDMSGQGGI